MEQISDNGKVQSNEEKSEDVKQQAFAQLAQGKRHLLVKDYSEAVTSLSEACTLFDSFYGPMANENGEVYYQYGVALLELARNENGILSTIPVEGEDSEESENESAEDEKSEGEGNENHEKNGTDTQASGSGTGDIEDPKGENAEEQDDMSDDLKLSWEMLEMAKTIFERQTEKTREQQLKLAEVYLRLGEVSLEGENYNQAVEDIGKCLKIQKQYLEFYSRTIAHTYYQLGLAFSLIPLHEEASINFLAAMNVIQQNISQLEEKKKIGLTPEEKNKSPFYSIEEEIEELNSLVPEIQEKVNDMQLYKQELANAERENIKIANDVANSEIKRLSDLASCSSSFSEPQPSCSSASDKTVTDITHLVRKKRKVDPKNDSSNNSK